MTEQQPALPPQPEGDGEHHGRRRKRRHKRPYWKRHWREIIGVSSLVALIALASFVIWRASDPLLDAQAADQPTGQPIVAVQAALAVAVPGDHIRLIEPDGDVIERLTPDLYAIQSLAWAPDGRQLLMAAQLGPGAKTDLFLVQGDGSALRQLTYGVGDNTNPVWSPDGRAIAFSSDRDGARDVYVIDAAGETLRRLTNGYAADEPTWSPDGRRVAFSAVRDGNRQIWVVDAEGPGEPQQLTTAGESTNPAWSPNGGTILFVGTRPSNGLPAVYSMSENGQNVRLLVVGTDCPTCPAQDPTWSFDGGQIAFTLLSGAQSLVYITTAEGKGALRVAPGRLPAWRP